MGKVYFIVLLHQNYLSHLSHSSCLACVARTNMHENYVNRPWAGFNILHIIKKLNKQKAFWKVFILPGRTACSHKTRFWGEWLPRLKPPAVPSEKTCLFREANRLRGLSLYPHFTKCCRFPLTSCGFVERDWKVIWKWLNLKTKQEKNWVSFFSGSLLARIVRCLRRPVCGHTEMSLWRQLGGPAQSALT